MGRKRKLWIVIPAAVVAVVLVFSVVGLLANRGGADLAANEEAARSSAGAPTASDGAFGTGALKGDEAQTAGESLDAAVPPATSRDASHHLMRYGDLSLLLARGTLVRTVDRINSLTVGMGGYVMSSTIGSDSGGGIVQPMMGVDDIGVESGVDVKEGLSRPTTIGEHPYASLTLRVPETRFDAAIKRFSALGEVQSMSTSSEDVTSQWVDVKARLRHFRAVEQRLVRFLAATRNVREMLAVQDRIDEVQLTIEQLSAQLTAMTEQTTYGTISVYLSEKGVPQTGAIDASDTFSGTFWHSLAVLGRGAHVSALALTAALPFVVVLGGLSVIAWFVTRRLRRGRGHAAPPSLPA